MPRGVQLRRHDTKRRPATLGGSAAKFAHARDDCGLSGLVPVRLDAFDAFAASSHALSRRAELQHQDVLFKLADRTQDLTNQCTGRIVSAVRQVYAVARENARADLLELADYDFLDHQLARQSIGSLDLDHHADAI